MLCKLFHMEHFIVFFAKNKIIMSFFTINLILIINNVNILLKIKYFVPRGTFLNN